VKWSVKSLSNKEEVEEVLLNVVERERWRF
jgi:hypothetical protein